LADTAFAYACNSRNRSTLAAAAEIQFLSPGRLGEVLVAHARERAASGRAGIYDIDVTERASGRMVALFRGRSHQVTGEIVATGTAT
jgi:acyl-CoA thioesterase